MSADFHKDLKSGHSAEDEVAALLTSFGCNVTSTQNQMLFEGYDLIVDFPGSKRKHVEVKSDELCFNTGNVAVEISKKDGFGKQVPSGLSATKSTHIIYKIPYPKFDKFYSIPTEKLKDLIRKLKTDNMFKEVWGGDNKNSRIVLIPEFIFRNNSKRIK